MSEQPDETGSPEVVEGAARALSEPADADISLLSAVHLGLHAVASGTTGHLPFQRPPGQGEDGLTARQAD